jgi:hypothetical protein
MKKIALIFSIMLISTLSWSQAQFSIGLKGGPNFASINTKEGPGENYKSRTGFHVGAFALIKLTKIGIQPEILFSQQGSKLSTSGKDFETNFTYFNVPIILKLYTIAGINLQLGPQFGFVTKAERDYFDAQSNSVKTEDIKSKLKGSDMSVAIGAGWDLPFGLTIDGRYNLGLSDINDSSGESVKNQVWQFSVGYKFIKLGK